MLVFARLFLDISIKSIVFSSWSLQFDFTRLLGKTTCWSISGEVSQERATKEHCAAGPRVLCFVQVNLSQRPCSERSEVFIFHNSGHEEFIKLFLLLFCLEQRPSVPCDTQKRESVVTTLNEKIKLLCILGLRNNLLCK